MIDDGWPTDDQDSASDPMFTVLTTANASTRSFLVSPCKEHRSIFWLVRKLLCIGNRKRSE